jgi:hypothetical protein
MVSIIRFRDTPDGGDNQDKSDACDRDHKHVNPIIACVPNLFWIARFDPCDLSKVVLEAASFPGRRLETVRDDETTLQVLVGELLRNFHSGGWSIAGLGRHQSVTGRRAESGKTPPLVPTHTSTHLPKRRTEGVEQRLPPEHSQVATAALVHRHTNLIRFNAVRDRDKVVQSGS